MLLAYTILKHTYLTYSPKWEYPKSPPRDAGACCRGYGVECSVQISYWGSYSHVPPGGQCTTPDEFLVCDQK